MKFISFLLVLFLLVGCNKDNSGDFVDTTKSTYYSVGDKIKLKSVIGNEVTLVRVENGFKIEGSDKILMFDIFGTYCQPCRNEAPHLMSFQLKYSNDFLMLGLIHFETITDEEIIDNFSKNYNAYYFISNSKENEKIIEQILKDINYTHALSIPFKVIYKDGKVMNLTNNEIPQSNMRNYYIGSLKMDILERDFLRIKGKN